jgi:transcriptional antiterminator RfaH
MTFMRNWYLIATKSRQENVAIKNLENQKYTIFCPNVIINNKQVILFPGYIFINLDKNTENWSPIRSTKGVLNFVRFGQNFAQVPDNVIEFIRANQLITKDKLINLHKFKPGEKVQITDGVFKNCIAIFKSFKSDERVILLMNILGQQQSINLKQKSLISL